MLPVGNANFVRAHPRVGAAAAKLKIATAAVIEREDIRADPSHLALLTGLDGRPGAGAWPPYTGSIKPDLATWAPTAPLSRNLRNNPLESGLQVTRMLAQR